jgi:prolyl 4-hydroxylase
LNEELSGRFERQYEAALERGELGEARRFLERGADAGEAQCAAQLGVWLLLGHGTARDDSAGFSLIDRAARAGVAEARRLLATLHAQGRGTHESWPLAIEWLVRGARCGDVDAMRQLAFLLPDECSADRNALLATAARAGDIAARRRLARDLIVSPKLQAMIDWSAIATCARRPEPKQAETVLISASPPVHLRRGLLSLDLCDYLMCLAAPHLTRASVNDKHAGTARIDTSRTNMYANFWLLEGDVVTDCIDRTIAALVGLERQSGEPLSVLRYLPGEQYAPHFDFFDLDSPVHAQEIARAGQRIMTCLVYLNADYSSGETEFVDVGLKVRGEPGVAAYWRNADDRGIPDLRTRHAGLPPASGQKWLLSKWFRDRSQITVSAPTRP